MPLVPETGPVSIGLIRDLLSEAAGGESIPGPLGVNDFFFRSLAERVFPIGGPVPFNEFRGRGFGVGVGFAQQGTVSGGFQARGWSPDPGAFGAGDLIFDPFGQLGALNDTMYFRPDGVTVFRMEGVWPQNIFRRITVSTGRTTGLLFNRNQSEAFQFTTPFNAFSEWRFGAGGSFPFDNMPTQFTPVYVTLYY